VLLKFSRNAVAFRGEGIWWRGDNASIPRTLQPFVCLRRCDLRCESGCIGSDRREHA